MFNKKKSKFKAKTEQNNDFELQITALIDTLVIILIFMLKSTSSETLEVETNKDIMLPSVYNGQSDATGVRLSISKEGLYWNGALFVETVNFTATNKDAEPGGANWQALSEAIQDSMKTEKEEQKYTGKVFLEADRDTPYPLLSAALRTARNNGYRDIRFVGSRYN